MRAGCQQAALLFCCTGQPGRAAAPAADVLIVGAGISGLTAASRLRAAGRSVIVLEAMPRVGGRLLRTPVVTPAGAKAWVDLGGQWLGPTQTRALELAKRLNVTLFDQPDEGAAMFCYGGKCTRHTYPFPFPTDLNSSELSQPWPGVNFTMQERDDVVQLVRKLEALAATIDPEKPWTSPNATKLDATTVDSWLDANARTRMGRWSVAALCRIGGNGAFEPHATSVLHLAWTMRVSPAEENPEAYLLDGGAGQLPVMLAAQLGADRIRLSHPVYSIKQNHTAGTVTAVTPQGSFAARIAIVAMPPHLTGRIMYDPPLPTLRDQLVQRQPMGSVIKVLLIYNNTWWRRGGLSGLSFGGLDTVEMTFDSTNPKPGSPGVLACFISGDAATRLASASYEQRRQAVLKDVVTLLGPKARSELVAFAEGNWPAERYTGGAYTSYMPPGVWTQYGPALRRPFKRILWAGTEMATRWPGFMDGGVRAGEDAADAALKML